MALKPWKRCKKYFMEANSYGEQYAGMELKTEKSGKSVGVVEQTPQGAWKSIDVQKSGDVVGVEDMSVEVFEALNTLGQIAESEKISLAFGGSFAKRSWARKKKITLFEITMDIRLKPECSDWRNYFKEMIMRG